MPGAEGGGPWTAPGVRRVLKHGMIAAPTPPPRRDGRRSPVLADPPRRAAPALGFPSSAAATCRPERRAAGRLAHPPRVESHRTAGRVFPQRSLGDPAVPWAPCTPHPPPPGLRSRENRPLRACCSAGAVRTFLPWDRRQGMPVARPAPPSLNGGRAPGGSFRGIASAFARFPAYHRGGHGDRTRFPDGPSEGRVGPRLRVLPAFH